MKIIAGKYRSRVLVTLEGLNTRPMMSRMKESVFNTIGPFFDGDVVLDLFGGSGALSLESLSRGASFSYIVEKSHEAVKIIKKNVDSLKENDNVKILNMDYKLALKKFKEENRSFDIIFLDPPYRLNIVSEIIDYINANNLLKDKGVIVCQYVAGNYKPQETDQLHIIKNYDYASSEVCIYQKKEDNWNNSLNNSIFKKR